MSVLTQQQKGTVRCKRCKRILTKKESIDRGYGPECIEAINLEVDLVNQARITDDWGFLCQNCEEKTPPELFRNGQCPSCFYGVTSLEEQDMIPFAEGP